MDNCERWVCNNTEPKAFYRKCIEHDVCDACGKKRADIEGIAWGTRTGFICDKCQRTKWEKRIADFNIEDCDKYDFMLRDDIKCPYCGHEYTNDDLRESTNDENCPNCNSYFKVEVEWTPCFSISKRESESTK